MKPVVVIKFGGTSVSNLKRWQQICAIIHNRLEQGFKVAVVHSAKSGLTNHLEAFTNSPNKKHIVAVEHSLKALAQALKVKTDISHFINELYDFAENKALDCYDFAKILSFGELMTTALAADFLKQHFTIEALNPKDIFIARSDDNRSLSSKVLSAKCSIKPMVLQHDVALMPGFIAADAQNRTVVLGRGGSDTSASYLAVALNAARVEIWTDVHGIFSANPHVVPQARLIEKIGYQEAREIAASGGKVLHPRCILPAEQNTIPLHIYNTQDANATGTVIKKGYESTSPRVRAINVRHNITLVSMDSMNMWHQAGFMGKIFRVYERLGLSIDIVVTAQTNVTLSLDTADNIINNEILADLKQQLSVFCDVTVYKNCSAVTLVGYRMRALLGKIAPIISNFSEQRIYLTSQSSNDLNTSIVVEEDQADKLLIALHSGLIVENANHYGFGATWQDLQARKINQHKPQASWWQTKAKVLLQLAKDSSPCYVYHEATIKQQIAQLKTLTAIDKIFFAMKANPNPKVIKTIFAGGIALETVSPGEIKRVQKTLPSCSAQDILFTPNFAALEEYVDAFKKGLHVTIDNSSILSQNPDIFANQEIILRLDPGHGDGHHRYVRTAGEQSKFGIHQAELKSVKQLCNKYNIRIKGLHAHTGSGILDAQNWYRILHYLTDKITLFPKVKIINIGGGLGITENPFEKGLDLDALNKIIHKFKQKYPNLHFWLEPGRFLVANAGVLLAKVTQTKVKGTSGYIGLETGMNSLIRPALYGAWHNIINLSKQEQKLEINATVVGPMCETGDILGVDRKLPATQVGDIFLIANSGAYGYSMASRYNLREPAKELFLPEDFSY